MFRSLRPGRRFALAKLLRGPLARGVVVKTEPLAQGILTQLSPSTL